MASVEEENYVRMSLLLSGVSPRATRILFDSEFAPICLEASLKKKYNNLFGLKKKHSINQSQWSLLFPRFPGKYRFFFNNIDPVVRFLVSIPQTQFLYYSKAKIILLRYSSA